uniref:Uncharacterized protein n=1 Tax=Oryza brachyantha TaxID=4533 RepID=J3M6E0_ORYBR
MFHRSIGSPPPNTVVSFRKINLLLCCPSILFIPISNQRKEAILAFSSTMFTSFLV